jgi:hypothetical protein
LVTNVRVISVRPLAKPLNRHFTTFMKMFRSGDPENEKEFKVSDGHRHSKVTRVRRAVLALGRDDAFYDLLVFWHEEVVARFSSAQRAAILACIAEDEKRVHLYDSFRLSMGNLPMFDIYDPRNRVRFSPRAPWVPSTHPVVEQYKRVLDHIAIRGVRKEMLTSTISAVVEMGLVTPRGTWRPQCRPNLEGVQIFTRDSLEWGQETAAALATHMREKKTVVIVPDHQSLSRLRSMTADAVHPVLFEEIKRGAYGDIFLEKEAILVERAHRFPQVDVCRLVLIARKKNLALHLWGDSSENIVFPTRGFFHEFYRITSESVSGEKKCTFAPTSWRFAAAEALAARDPGGVDVGKYTDADGLAKEIADMHIDRTETFLVLATSSLDRSEAWRVLFPHKTLDEGFEKGDLVLHVESGLCGELYTQGPPEDMTSSIFVPSGTGGGRGRAALASAARRVNGVQVSADSRLKHARVSLLREYVGTPVNHLIILVSKRVGVLEEIRSALKYGTDSVRIRFAWRAPILSFSELS